MKKFFVIIFGTGLLLSSLLASALAAPSNRVNPGGTFQNNFFISPAIIKVSVNSTADFSDCGVSFFTDTNFQGSKVVLVAGKYTQEELQAYGLMNDSISSIKIPVGYIVKVYQNNNLSGRSATLTTSVQNLNDYGLNDTISSIQISIFPLN